MRGLCLAGLVGVLAAATTGCGDDGGGSARGGQTTDDYQRGLPFTEPEELVSEDGVLRATLRSARAEVDVSGRVVTGEVYNGAFIGPTLRVRPGDRIELSLTNELDQHTNIHYHGLHVSPSGLSDDVFRMIDSGTTALYIIDVPPDHETGTFWYHSHLHMLAEQQVFGGLSGVLIVDGLEEKLPAPLDGIPSRTLALKDLQVEDGAIVSANIDSNAPTTRTVNGLVEPVIAMAPGSTELWRIGNIGADIFYDVELDGVVFTVVTEDGSPVEEFWTADHLVLPPGKRYDVLVQPAASGEIEFRTRAYDQGGDQYPEAVLARVRLEGEGVDPLPLPTGAFAEPFSFGAVTRERTKVFTEDEETSVFMIDGKVFDMNRVDDEVELGATEDWTLRNETSEQHPFHIHVNDFRVLSVDGQPYDAKGRQDTVILPANGEVVVRIPFYDFDGRFVYHCHILNHEDHGMMAVVQVNP